RWKALRPPTAATSKFSFCTPLLIRVNGQEQLITPGSGIVQALNPRDGTEIWRVMYGVGFSVVPRPIFAHGLLFLSSGYEQPVAYAIRPDGRGDVTNTHVAWTATKRIPTNPSMLVVGDELYMLADSGVLSCRDARTGQVHYEERILGNCSASLLAGEGRIYALDERGAAAVVKAGKNFQLLATNELQEQTLASMAVCDNDLLIRTEAALYRIGRK
ncbi:MAG: serine/threonine protein kinase, partial [Armatimonadetes bacterium]|nr:serine/threonine protein kinase [Armatimonadota bacterium]